MWALVVVIVALLAERAWRERAVGIERRRLINAVMARTPQDFAVLNRIDDAPTPQREPVEPTPIPIGLDG